jgi:hypothetical protein
MIFEYFYIYPVMYAISPGIQISSQVFQMLIGMVGLEEKFLKVSEPLEVIVGKADPHSITASAVANCYRER